jgi:hypothetical protein
VSSAVLYQPTNQAMIALRCRVNPGLVRDLPHRAGCHLVAEADQFAVDPAAA